MFRLTTALPWPVFLLALVPLARPSVAGAQTGFETIGTRAQGMAGAFVAVADDATATYWNPAGLAAIPIFDVALGFGQAEQSHDVTAQAGSRPAWRSTTTGFALALPVLGVSYYRLHDSRAEPGPTAADGSVRQDANPAFLGSAVTTTHLGVSLVQSLGDLIVVGGTLRLVRAGAAIGTLSAPDPGDALDRVDDLETTEETKFDADLGVLLYLGHARVGLTVRNLVAPTWDADPSLPLTSDRLARVGVAFGPGPVRVRRSWTIAADADLTTVAGPDGDCRAVAVGAERWFLKSRVGLRGGARAQTVGDARPVASGGASLGIWSGLLLEAHVTAGGDAIERGWSLGARVTF